MSGNCVPVPANEPLYELKSASLCCGDDPNGLFIRLLVDEPRADEYDKEIYLYLSNAKQYGKDFFGRFLKEIEQKIDQMP